MKAAKERPQNYVNATIYLYHFPFDFLHFFSARNEAIIKTIPIAIERTSIARVKAVIKKRGGSKYPCLALLPRIWLSLLASYIAAMSISRTKREKTQPTATVEESEA